MYTVTCYSTNGQFMGRETFNRLFKAKQFADHKCSMYGCYVIEGNRKTRFSDNCPDAVREYYD